MLASGCETRAGTSAGAGAGLAAPGAHEALARSVATACSDLGARVIECPLPVDARSPIDWERIERRARQSLEGLHEAGAGVDVLVTDCASLFARAGGGRAALRACVDATWTLTQAVVGDAFLTRGRGGRIVFIAPAPSAGEHAAAALAALENLARTLSVEWARYALTVVTIAPGPGSGTGSDRDPDTGAQAAGEASALVAYLASPAGAYFSGCLLDLRGTGERLTPAGAEARS